MRLQEQAQLDGGAFAVSGPGVGGTGSIYKASRRRGIKVLSLHVTVPTSVTPPPAARETGRSPRRWLDRGSGWAPC